jgi:hypothetical protein
VTQAQVRKLAALASQASAALIPLAAGGRDGDGRSVVDAAEAIRRAEVAIREACRVLDGVREGKQ